MWFGTREFYPRFHLPLAQVDPMLELLPDATVHHIGMYRSNCSLLPVQYYNRLPKEHSTDIAIVLEPMIATAGTLVAVIDQLKAWNVPKIMVLSVIASKAGLDRTKERHPDVTVRVGQIDELLSDVSSSCHRCITVQYLYRGNRSVRMRAEL